MQYEIHVDPERGSPEVAGAWPDAGARLRRPRLPQNVVRPRPVNERIQAHYDVLDRLEDKWAPFEPDIGDLRVDDEWEFGPQASIGCSRDMENDIISACTSAHVLPAYLLTIGLEGTLGGIRIEGSGRFRSFCVNNPLLLATIERVCERALDAEMRRRLIGELRQMELELSGKPTWSEQQRVDTLREKLSKATGSPSALRLVAREALGTGGEPPPTTAADSRLTRLLASALALPHPMGAILRNFMSDAGRHRVVEPDIVRARARSVLCARFESDLPTLELIAKRLDLQFGRANDEFADHVKASGARSSAARDAARKAQRIDMACRAAEAALLYLKNQNRYLAT